MQKISLIFGVTGQDGSYLSEYLIEKGHRVIGVIRRCSTDNKQRIREIDGLEVLEGDITDFISVNRIISDCQPNEIYNLAAQSHVHTSFNEPLNTFNINTLGVINILEAIRKNCPKAKFLQASTSEMFGSNYDIVDGKKVQNEDTKFNPVSPYAVSKVAAHHMVDIYRDAYSMFACSFIGMNHESPRRGVNFVTRKITNWLGHNIEKIRAGEKPKLHLGNIYSYRDWSHAKDFVKAMYLILQQDKPKNYMLCSNETHTVEEFLESAFGYLGLNWKEYVAINGSLKRPLEVDYLCGDSTNTRQELGWSPKYSFIDLVKDMVESDIKNKHVY